MVAPKEYRSKAKQGFARTGETIRGDHRPISLAVPHFHHGEPCELQTAGHPHVLRHHRTRPRQEISAHESTGKSDAGGHVGCHPNGRYPCLTPTSLNRCVSHLLVRTELTMQNIFMTCAGSWMYLANYNRLNACGKDLVPVPESCCCVDKNATGDCARMAADDVLLHKADPLQGSNMLVMMTTRLCKQPSVHDQLRLLPS
nr:hypothetical protein CFP56_67397 [Quercus suber]